MTRRKSQGRFTVFLAVVLALVLGEVFFRVLGISSDNQNREFHPFIEFGNARYAEVSVSPEGPESLGYEKSLMGYFHLPTKPIESVSDQARFIFQDRVKEAFDSQSKDLRIFVMGGSVAHGDHASSPETRWFMQLQSELRKDFSDPKIHLIPAALPGFNSTQERVELELFVLPLKPSAIVIIDGINDVYAATVRSRPGDPFNQGATYARLYSPFVSWVRWASDYSALIRWGMQKSIERVIWAQNQKVWNQPQLFENQISSIVSIYVENVRAMKRRCDQEKIPCFHFLQPARAISERNVNSKYFEGMDWKIYQRILAAWKKGDLGLGAEGAQFDMTHLLDSRMDLFTDGMHMRDEGQALMARHVKRALIERKPSIFR